MKTIDLEFDDYPDTYTVIVQPVTLTEYEKVGDLFRAAGVEFQVKGETQAIKALVTELVKVAKPTVKGKAAKLLDLDPNLILAIAQRWNAGVREVPLPLPRGSGSTASSQPG